MTIYYTGVGARRIPKDIAEFMTEIGIVLEEAGYMLRSGASDGSDYSFEKKVRKLKEIYLPWHGFNGSDSKLVVTDPEAYRIASGHHPGWDHLKDASKKFMARNACQVLGLGLNTKSKFVICWTEDGAETARDRTPKTGGTGLAIALADSLGIEVLNLKNKISYNKVKEFIQSIKESK